MNVGQFFDRITALLGSAEQHAAKVSALTAERDLAQSHFKDLFNAREDMHSEVQRLTGELETAKASAAAAAQAATEAKASADAAKAEASVAKADAEKLKANPSAQAAAVLASVGHAPISATTGSTGVAAETPPEGLTGMALAKWHHARGRGVTGPVRN